MAAPSLVITGGAASATSLARLSQWCHEHLGPYPGGQPIAAAAETRPYDLPWVVLDHAAVTARYGWRPHRSPADIFTEIATAARDRLPTALPSPRDRR